MKAIAIFMFFSLLLLTPRSSASRIFFDALAGTTSSTDYSGVTLTPEGVMLSSSLAYLRYPGGLPRTNGTISFVLLAPNAAGMPPVESAPVLFSNEQYNSGATWPTFQITTGSIGEVYSVRLAYQEFPGGAWYEVSGGLLPYGKSIHIGVSWGSQGQQIWADGSRIAYDPSNTRSLAWWDSVAGVGKTFTAGGQVVPVGARISNLAIYDTQLPDGDSSPVPEPSGLLMLIGGIGGLVGRSLRIKT